MHSTSSLKLNNTNVSLKIAIHKDLTAGSFIDTPLVGDQTFRFILKNF